MKDINSIITKNFQDNILYLENEQGALFAKLSVLDSAIVNGYYQEKYELVYENDGFDVLEKSSQHYLYAKESFSHTLITANSVNYKIDNSLLEGFVRHNFTKDDLKSFEQEKPFENYKSDVAPIINYIQENSVRKKELKTIDKFVFFGVGLGLHVEAIHNKIKAKVYLVIEDDLELFRLSLFTTNYKEVAQTSTLVFSVFENMDEFMLTSSKFLDIKHEYNHYIKFFHLLSHSEEKINNFNLAITSQPHIRFHFNNLMKQYMQPLEYLFNDYKFLHNSMSFSNSNFKESSFLLLAMGPSLQNNIQWLEKNHKKFITIAVSSSLSFLEEKNISPDIILHIDPFEWGITSFNKLKDVNFIKESICLFSTATPKNIVSLIDKDKLFFFETGTDYKNTSFKLSSPCVGSLGLQLLLILKAKNIYMLGVDLAVDSKTGKTHSGDHQSLKELSKKQNSFDDSISYKETLFEVDGNFSAKVNTTPGYYISIYTIDYFTTNLKGATQKIYNLSNGAKFSNTIPTTTSSVNLTGKSTSIHNRQELCEFFLQNSQNKITDKELHNFKNKLTHAKELQKFLKNYKSKESMKVDEYLEEIFLHVVPNADMQKYELNRILDTYLQYISSYIYDFFNSNHVTNYGVHLKSISSLLQKHLINIIQHYQNLLEDKLNAKH